MDYIILVFTSRDVTQKFLRAATQGISGGIEWENLAENVVLVTWDEHVSSERASAFASIGFQSIIGEWAPVWFEHKELLDEFLQQIKPTEAEYVRAFYGGDLKVIVAAHNFE